MSSLRHPYIIHIYEVFENKDKIVLVMEYAAGGELYDFISSKKVLEEGEARRIFRQVAMAVYYCHVHQICHRDLKLENILLDEEGNAKIADFGLSNVFDSKRMLTTFCGSPLYASPEIVKGIPYYGPEVDCWSLGVLLYTLVYGAMPFDGSNFKRLVKQISNGDYFEPKTPSSGSALIRALLTVDATERLDIVGVCSHPWLNTETSDPPCVKRAIELSTEKPVRLDLLLSLAAPVQMAVGDVVKSQSADNLHPTTVHKRQSSEPEDAQSKTNRRKGSGPRERSRTRKGKAQADTQQVEETPGEVLETAKAISAQLEHEPITNEVENHDLPLKEEESEAVSTVLPEAGAAVAKSGTVSLETVSQSSTVPVSPAISPTPVQPVGRNVKTERPLHPKPFVVPMPPSSSRVSNKVSSPVSPPLPPTTGIDKRQDYRLASTVHLDQVIRMELEKEPQAGAVGVGSGVAGQSGDEAGQVEGAEEKVVRSKSDEDRLKKEQAVKVISEAITEGALSGDRKAMSLPRRRYSRELSRPLPVAPRVTDVGAPPVPSPRTSLVRQDSPREHIIPIMVESRENEPCSGAASTASVVSKGQVTRQSSVASSAASSSSITGGFESEASATTVKSDSRDPIRKSPREVIIPIALEGGDIITPTEQTLSQMSSKTRLDKERPEPTSNLGGFVLHSTRRRPRLAETTADSVSSDEEDDNFEILTAENLFSTLLSRVRSLTQRLNEDPRSGFPSMFSHESIFDRHPTLRRSGLMSSEMHSASNLAPWRRQQSSLSSATLPRARVTVHVPLVETD